MGCPSSAWTHWHKSPNSLVRAVRFAGLLCSRFSEWYVSTRWKSCVSSTSVSMVVWFSGHINVSIQGASWISMVGSHNMHFICIAISLVSISYFSKYCFEWWMWSKAAVSWHECYSDNKMVESLTRQEWCKAWCVVVCVLCTFQLTAWNFPWQSLYRVVECWSILCRVLFHCEVSHHGTSVKGYNWWSPSRAVDWLVS